ncbi:MAG: hypothetical protein M1820_008139 [Bogoriella megaspora]|nr:MAG: hypothetical protein M1820_008139 [Bogoriella megaspora]
MALSLRVITFAAFVVITTAFPNPSSHVLHEQHRRENGEWIRTTRVNQNHYLPMRIGLAQQNLEKGYDHVMEVADPRSLLYGQHWSAKEVHDAFAPTEEAETVVKDWLVSAGISANRIKHYENRGWLAFDATAEEAENLLHAEFYEHEHRYSDKIRVGCSRYHLPKHVSSHVDYITPGVKLTPVIKRDAKTKKRATRKSYKQPARLQRPANAVDKSFKTEAALDLPADLQDCGNNITPACIKALYQIPNATLASPGNSLGLYEQGDYFNKEDLDLFYANYAPYVPQGTYPIPALIDGAQYGVAQNDTALNGGESNIDIDMSYSLIYPQTVTLYQVDDQIYEPIEIATTNLFNTFLDALDGSYCNYTAYNITGDSPDIDPVYPNPAPGGYKGTRQCGVYKPTQVISASYLQSESDLPINYVKRQCNEFMKLALQGHSILVASGDHGVGSFFGDPSPNGCLGPTGNVFSPQYPSGCPFITSVGGSQIYGNQTVLDAESVMNDNLGGSNTNFTSAGGFSNYFGQPDYQKAAVAQYLTENNPPYPYYEGFGIDPNSTNGGIYNRIGRGFPDVSANGANFRAYTNGRDLHFFGSSLSSPLFASVLTLINEQRYVANKGPVGFVNPVLYANPQVLNDVTNGTNNGCGTEGFPAAKGWDPSTGLGTPNYPKMLDLFMSLP